MAILAAYMCGRDQEETLEAYLDSKVFSQTSGIISQPRSEDAAGFDCFMENYKSALAAERAAVTALK